MRGLAFATSVCGARTHACSVHTRVNAFSPSPISARPGIFLSRPNQPGLHRIFLKISRNPLPLPIVPHAMVVRFPLPERLSRSPKYPVRLSRRDALKRLQQQARRYQGPQQHMHMVRHNHKRANIILPQFGALENGSDHEFRNAALPQEHGTGSRMVEIPVHPDKCLPARELGRGRIPGMGKTAMQVPTDKEPVVGRVDVRQPSSRIHYLGSAKPSARISNIRALNHTYTRGLAPTLSHIPTRSHFSHAWARHLSCGARTYACSVHTRVNASAPLPRTLGVPRSKRAHTPLIAPHLPNISRSHECERCTHKCVRHNPSGNVA
jgi:hypothetical protein